jgi:hypothetical protein
MPPFFAHLYYVHEPRYNTNGELKPEEHMPDATVGAFIVPISVGEMERRERCGRTDGPPGPVLIPV